MARGEGMGGRAVWHATLLAILTSHSRADLSLGGGTGTSPHVVRLEGSRFRPPAIICARVVPAAHELTSRRPAAFHPGLRQGERLGCVGSTPELGAWKLENARELTRTGADGKLWTTALPVNKSEVLYKYVVITDPEAETQNRTLTIPADAPASFTVFDTLGEGEQARSLGMSDEHGSSTVSECRFEISVGDSDDVTEIQVIGSDPALGDWRVGNGVFMERQENSSLWVGSAELPVGRRIEYKYAVWRTGQRGGLQRRKLHIPADGSKIHVRDKVDVPTDASEAALVQRRSSPQKSCLCQFDVEVDGADEGTSVSIVGSHELLGRFEPARAVPMLRTQGNTFSAFMHLPSADLEYTYIVKSAALLDEQMRHVQLQGDVTVKRDRLGPALGSAALGAMQTFSATPPLVVPGGGLAAHAGPGGAKCVFRARYAGNKGASQGVPVIIGDWNGWNMARCLRMQPSGDGLDGVYTASAILPVGTKVLYKYATLREPRWEDRVANRALLTSDAVFAACAWASQRHDNTRLAKRVRDVVGEGGQGEQEAQAAFAHAAAPSISLAADELAALGDSDWTLEPRNPALSGTCLMQVTVEVAGLSGADDEVWLAGDTSALGSWDVGQGVRLLEVGRAGERLGGDESSSSSSSEMRLRLFSALIRVPVALRVAYKYFVARTGLAPRSELGPDRRLEVPRHDRGAVFDSFLSPLGASDGPPLMPSCEHAQAAAGVGLHEGHEPQSRHMLVPRETEHVERGEEEEEDELVSCDSELAVGVFTVAVHGLTAEEDVYVCGSCSSLGEWDVTGALPLLRRRAPRETVEGRAQDGAGCDYWCGHALLPAGQSVKYKYLIRKPGAGGWRWEEGADRSLAVPSDAPCQVVGSHPKPETRNSKPETLNPKPETRSPKPETRSPKPETRNPKPETLNRSLAVPSDAEGYISISTI